MYFTNGMCCSYIKYAIYNQCMSLTLGIWGAAVFAKTSSNSLIFVNNVPRMITMQAIYATTHL